MVEARFSVLITMLLVLVTIFNSAINKIPDSTSSITALVEWIIVMLVLIFLALAQNCFVLFFDRKRSYKYARNIRKRRRNNLDLPNENDNISLQRMVTENITINFKIDTEILSSIDNLPININLISFDSNDDFATENIGKHGKHSRIIPTRNFLKCKLPFGIASDDTFLRRDQFSLLLLLAILTVYLIIHVHIYMK